MKCLIIDDEPLAIEIVESYLTKVEGVTIVGKCTNPLAAITILNKHQVDLVFLDIEMPNITGIELVKSLDNLPQFIFTTAYPEYALEGFELNATDYLVKPIPFHRFLKAISRAKEKFESERISPITSEVKETSSLQESDIERDFIFVKSEYENIKINIQDIKFMEGLKDYIKIYTTTSTKPILTLLSFKEILDKLPEASFLRVHRSFIVNVKYIKSLQKTKIVIEDFRIPIGETYKKEVLERLGL
ncbi:LytR/AlgR family response regulator transcription factor [Ulvibacter litoralis]|uniref:DNA-binding response regulator, LytR/AlgR family n=1 Tax=Ulvibacter litoralis TaxID=227084 RepID=A0A1G7CLX8_9FLAO|nr:LytTR family DNA-binding domain-containing protein [Ulvibacter litoralis]GHC46835.1 DNA-binding response regulator [Ulvibacter litoralis]SDE40339.1 DNA-binding response regulator, LytR/AlgR family [Ulvibacter litoralis]